MTDRIDPDTYHVYPASDLIEHETTGDGCPCGPELEAVPRDDGSYGWLLIHHSLDGRLRPARTSATKKDRSLA